ncbi:hypothetical protein EJB05_49387, partial [Eragrostis curvula]
MAPVLSAVAIKAAAALSAVMAPVLSAAMAPVLSAVPSSRVRTNKRPPLPPFLHLYRTLKLLNVSSNLFYLLEMASRTDLREAKGPGGWTVLPFAAARGHLNVCKFLVEESRLDVNCATADGETPMAHAAAAGAVSLLRYVPRRPRRPPGDAQLHGPHAAAPCGTERWHTEAVILLLSEGVDVDPIINSRNGGKPLIMAAGKGHDQWRSVA